MARRMSFNMAMELALEECKNAPPGDAGIKVIDEAIERLARRIERMPKPPKRKSEQLKAVNRNAQRRLEQLRLARDGR